MQYAWEELNRIVRSTFPYILGGVIVWFAVTQKDREIDTKDVALASCQAGYAEITKTLQTEGYIVRPFEGRPAR